MKYDVLIAGGGIAGLTAAAYLSKAGYHLLLCEKEHQTGGLVNSFVHDGFVFDGGIRAIENSGIVQPMLKQLDINLDFLPNPVSIGIGDDIITLTSKDSLTDYRELLIRQFPAEKEDILKITHDIARIMKYMDVLYGIDNPIFLDIQKDRAYLMKTILPWMFKYLATIGKIEKLTMPAEEYLLQFSDNPVLINLIAQHFFKQTPAFFAMSYFSLYLDYRYPKGGTGTLSKTLTEYIIHHGGEIKTDTEIVSIDPTAHSATDSAGKRIEYHQLIWAADLKKMYAELTVSDHTPSAVKETIDTKREQLSNLRGGDSILTLYAKTDLAPAYFAEKASAHFFYTPYKKGLHDAALTEIKLQTSSGSLTEDKLILKKWIQTYLKLTTYEISIPVLRDGSLAPKDKTGLIISTLFDYTLTNHIKQLGWYEEFKRFCEETILDVLSDTIYPELKQKTFATFSSTPITIEQVTGSSDGAITGWAFTNSSIPVVHEMKKIAKSIETELPDIFQIGQWSYSPSGMPISILTGKLAADRVVKALKKL